LGHGDVGNTEVLPTGLYLRVLVERRFIANRSAWTAKRSPHVERWVISCLGRHDGSQTAKGGRKLPNLTLWGLFVVASLVLLLTPGPAVLYIVARSIKQGRAAGLVSVLGIHLGTIVHITAAAVGLSALIVSSALAFAIIKYLGAAYLIWIGIRTFVAKDSDSEAPTVPAEPLRRVFRDGFVVNLFNPKTAIFFLAFLPQFVDPARGALHWQILFLGLTFAASICGGIRQRPRRASTIPLTWSKSVRDAR
jgi:threonine/homoserine/homoserine lactone efflux protein